MAEIMCDCPADKWEPCACGNQPPRHCMYCCGDLSDEQLKQAGLTNDTVADRAEAVAAFASHQQE